MGSSISSKILGSSIRTKDGTTVSRATRHETVDTRVKSKATRTRDKVTSSETKETRVALTLLAPKLHLRCLLSRVDKVDKLDRADLPLTRTVHTLYHNSRAMTAGTMVATTYDLIMGAVLTNTNEVVVHVFRSRSQRPHGMPASSKQLNPGCSQAS